MRLKQKGIWLWDRNRKGYEHKMELEGIWIWDWNRRGYEYEI